MEALKEALQQLISVVNSLSILANNPDHGSSSVRLIQGIQVLTECGNDAFIPKEHHISKVRIGLHTHYTSHEMTCTHVSYTVHQFFKKVYIEHWIVT